MMSGQVYALVDRLTGDVRYIGVTVLSLRARLAAHRSAAGRTAHPISQWMLTADCEIVLLEECESSMRYKRERHWIRKMADEGANLLNVTHC